MRYKAVFGFLALTTVAAGSILYIRSDVSTAAAPVASPADTTPTVRTVKASVQSVPIYIQGIGRVDPFNTVQIRSRVDGQIDKVQYAEGQEVKAGDVLIQIDPRPYQALVSQAEGQLAKDEAQLVSAKADLERARVLLEKGFGQAKTFDTQSALVNQTIAAIKVDQGALDAAKLNLGFTTIHAPISGRIGKRMVDAGNIIQASASAPLAEIVQLHPIAVLITVPQETLPDIQRHQHEHHLTVTARSSDNERKIADGELILIGNNIDRDSGTIELKAVFENSDEALWPGQFVNAQVVTHIREDAIAVPASAVQPGQQGKFVYVVNPNSTLEVRLVKLGLTIDGRTIIENGLKIDEIVVIENQDALAPGMRVHTEARLEEPALTGRSPTGTKSGEQPS